MSQAEDYVRVARVEIAEILVAEWQYTADMLVAIMDGNREVIAVAINNGDELWNIAYDLHNGVLKQ